MQLEHSFTVPVGIDDAWRILLDIELIGPCMPGAQIDSVDGDDFTGTVKVKLGPINLTYKGKASFIEKDEVAHRAVIDARGRDSRGNGTAAAKVTAVLSESDGQTTVKVNTDLDITGKPAQFGRGVMVDVGNKLIGQFADSLSRTISGDTPTAAAPAPAKKAAPAKQAAAGAPVDQPKELAAATAEGTAPQPVEAATDGPAVPPPSAASVAEPASTESSPEPAGTESASPAASPAASPPASPNGHTTVRPPAREVEPINLIESAGPAVAKRVAPVAVALVVVLIAVKRRRGKRR